MRRFISTVLAALVVVVAVPAAPGAVLAQQEAPSRAERLFDLLQLDEIMTIMQEEGLDYGAEVQKEMLGGQGGARWMETVRQIYSFERMRGDFAGRLERELDGFGPGLEEVFAFFGSERGQRIIGLEISARRAMLDPDVDAAARANLEDMRERDDPRLAPLRRFVEVNDLVESNVAGGLNANLAFYFGLVESGGLGRELSEGEILADVWAQEGAIREQTEGWVYSFLAMAYRPLDPEDMDAYIAFSETSPGQRYNRALFAAFDEMFENISRDLGFAAGRVLSATDL